MKARPVALRPLLWSVLVLLFLAAGASLRAASTGSSALYMPQGDSAGTANGDYITSTAGLDTVYRYFIEVPAGQSRLVVDIFDADIGAGVGEALIGRDRARDVAGGSVVFDSTATYSLVNPAGATRNTRFTTGNTTLPAGGDNAWLALFDSTGDNVRDNFTTQAYTNQDGTVPWATDWAETGDDGVATDVTNDIFITTGGGTLRMGTNSADGDTIRRSANLSGNGFTNATLSFDFSTTGDLESDDILHVEASSDGTTWTDLTPSFNGTTAAGTYTRSLNAYTGGTVFIRFRVEEIDNNSEYFILDNVFIEETGENIDNGHWELRVSMADGPGDDDDINAIGIRAHDGTSGSGGTEYNVYYDSHNQFGVNPDDGVSPADGGANSRQFDIYPYLTSGCTARESNFDFDSASTGNTSSASFTSRDATFTHNVATASLSANNVWDGTTFTGWTTDQTSVGYGIWDGSLTITTYTTPAINGNYANEWLSNFNNGSDAPTANPSTNAFRVYLPSDAGTTTAPAKAYVEQLLAFSGCGVSGPNPPQVGQTSCFTVTVRVVNPGAQAITFSTSSNVVTANVPGGAVLYAGGEQHSTGVTLVSAPSVGGSGDVVWNPGSVAAGATALMSYRINVTPTSAARIAVTGTPTSNGTRAQFVDSTGNTTQTRATYLFGPLCELAVTPGNLTQAVVSSFRALPAEGGGVVVEWTTASEAGTAGFRLFRRDPASKRWTPLHRGLLAGLQSAAQGGAYRFLDEGVQPGETLVYRLEEVESGGATRSYGPYRVAADRGSREVPAAMTAAFQRAAHAAPEKPRGAAVEAKAKAAAAARATPTGAVDSGNGLWLGVDEKGLYSLSIGDLAAWFGVPSGRVIGAIQSGKLLLRRGGTEVVPWHPDYLTDGTGRVVVNPQALRGILFYGVAEPTTYSQLTAYRLELGAEGTQMRAASVDGAAVDPAASFVDRQRSERDAFAATVLPLDASSDYWFWDFLMAGDPTFGQRTFAVDAPGAVAGSAATLYLDLQGATSGAYGNHDAIVALNGHVLDPGGESAWTGIEPQRLAYEVPAGVMLATGNVLQVTGAGTAGNIFYVDGFDLSYDRAYATNGDGLTFTASLARGAVVRGFSNGRVRLLDVGDPNDPIWLTGGSVSASKKDGYVLAFGAWSIGPFLAVGTGAVRVPAEVRGWSAPAEPADAELLIVAPAAWSVETERLAEVRRGEGLEVRVATVEEIADAYGQGIATPQALRAAVRAERKDEGRLRYLLLAGDASVDYRNLLGYDESKVPALFVTTPQGLFPSDNRYGDFDDDGLPELAVGRLPARMAADLATLVDKLDRYATAPDTGWMRRVTMLADSPSGGADFSADSERAAGLLQSRAELERIYLADLPIAVARGQLNAAFHQGAAIVSYFGHGGLDRLSGAGLLTSGDVPALTNGAKLPLLAAMTCTINRFAVPNVPALGELLVKSGAGGAAAVLAPSGTANAGDSRALALRLFGQPELFAGGETPRLGDWLLGGYGRARAEVADPQLFDLYSLLGDPSMRMRLGAPPPPPGGGPPSQE